LADDYAALLADLGHNAAAARVIGAADARRDRTGAAATPLRRHSSGKPLPTPERPSLPMSGTGSTKSGLP
jgi:hypothetical protein